MSFGGKCSAIVSQKSSVSSSTTFRNVFEQVFVFSATDAPGCSYIERFEYFNFSLAVCSSSKNNFQMLVGKVVGYSRCIIV